MEKYKKELTIALIAAVCVLCLLLVVTLNGKNAELEETETAQTEEIETEETEEATETETTTEESETAEESESEIAAETESETEETEEAYNPLESLTEELSGLLDDYAGNWSLALIEKTNDEMIQVGDEPVKAASLIKLFIMAATYEQIEFGYLEESQEVQDLLRKMITVSDNAAANKLVEMVSDEGSFEEGTAVVNTYAAMDMECYSTHIMRKLGAYENSEESNDNYTSAADCARLLNAIYDGTCVSEEASEKMMELLEAQERTGKIPQGLPSGVTYGNKTGELPGAEHDAAIIYGETADYILCITSDEVPDTSAAASNIASLSKIIYEALNE